MNDLLSRSFSGGRVAEMGNTAAQDGTNLEKFFKDVEEIKKELKELETLHNQLQQSNEQSKTLYNANAIKALRTKMDNDVASSLNKAKHVKNGLEALDRSTDANRSLPGCGPGSSTDRTRVSVVNGLRKQLQTSMKSFTDLRQKMASEHGDTVQRRYYTVTGETADEATVDTLISTGHDAVMEIERNLKVLHQVFMDMAVLVETQGEQLDDIKSLVNRANSFVRGGTQQLQVARKTQLNTILTCYGVCVLIFVIAFVGFSIR